MDEHISFKCAACKQPIYVIEYDGSFVLFGNHYYHSKCLTNKMVHHSQKNRRWAEDEVRQNLLDLQQTTQPHILQKLAKHKICLLISEHYGLAVITNLIFTRLDAIYSGTYKGLTKPLPPEHLLDMWTSKLSWLDKQVIKYKSNSDMPRGQQRVFYDLAILVNKYDDYLNWLQTKETEKSEIEKRNKKRDPIIKIERVLPQSSIILKGGVDLSEIAIDIWD